MKTSELPPDLLRKIEAANASQNVKDGKPVIALGIVPATKMNKTEAAYAGRLKNLKASGRIKDYRPHPFSLKLAENLHYRPDFIVVEADLSLTIVEVKGPWIEEDSIVKFKAAKAILPFLRFRMDQLVKGEWSTIRELA